ncbi:MAG: glycogen synthase GlgA [Actinobacteria bacterium]|nr:glycogen synthase GlgA [Actinomycetota bacterium]
MRVLFVSSECYPLAKTGGLADVAGALPLALAPLGVDARVLMPGYPGVRDQLIGTTKVASLPGLFGGDATLVAGTTVAGLQVLLIEAPHLFTRSTGGLYLGPDGTDWPDNHLRFGALSWVGAAIAMGRVGTWAPDLVHLHDWQAGLTAAYLRYDREAARAPGTLLTIHNLAFQGLFPPATRASLLLPSQALDVDGMEYWGQLSFLKAGVQWSDRLSTVSPTYAREILTPNEGMGFDGLLRLRAHELTGIVNGIDDSVWDPANDPHVGTPYTSRKLAAKAANKAALQHELGLEVRAETPLFSVVSRLTTQKGLDLLVAALPRLVATGAQLVVLGTGDPTLEAGFVAASVAHPGQVATVIGFDEALSHRIQAGADAVVMPSRFEPCGLTQLYGLRYGTLPVVARVGGLADTVIDANEAALRDGVATGVQFSPVEADPLAVAIERTVDLFRDRTAWQRTQRRAMSRDVGWDVAAGRYLSLYQEILAHRSR